MKNKKIVREKKHKLREIVAVCTCGKSADLCPVCERDIKFTNFNHSSKCRIRTGLADIWENCTCSKDYIVKKCLEMGDLARIDRHLNEVMNENIIYVKTSCGHSFGIEKDVYNHCKVCKCYFCKLRTCGICGKSPINYEKHK